MIYLSSYSFAELSEYLDRISGKEENDKWPPLIYLVHAFAGIYLDSIQKVNIRL